MGSIAGMRMKNLLQQLGVRYRNVELDGLTDDEVGAMRAQSGAVPCVYIGGKCVGGLEQLRQQIWSGELSRALKSSGVDCSSSHGSTHFCGAQMLFPIAE